MWLYFPSLALLEESPVAVAIGRVLVRTHTSLEREWKKSLSVSKSKA